MNRLDVMLLPFSVKDRILFAKRLSILLRAGVPILQALDMLAQSSPAPRTRKMQNDIRDAVANGTQLCVALTPFEGVFGSYFMNVVRVGETSGTLPESLNHIANELEKKHTLRKKIVGALIYPAIILLATIAITTLLLVGIFPKILPVFLSLKTELPVSTKIVIAVSAFLKLYGVWLFVLLMFVCTGIFFLFRIQKFHLMFDHILIRIPLLGKLSLHYNTATIARTLGVLLHSGVTILPALDIARDNVQNFAYKNLVDEMAGAITKGKSISTTLKLHPALVPHLATQLVEVGESTGTLCESLFHVSAMYEDEIDTLSKNLLQTLEPILMIVMGSLVGFIAISIITPIYGISQNLHG